MEKSEEETPFLNKVLWICLNKIKKKKGNIIQFIGFEISYIKLINYFWVLKSSSLICSLNEFTQYLDVIK